MSFSITPPRTSPRTSPEVQSSRPRYFQDSPPRSRHGQTAASPGKRSRFEESVDPLGINMAPIGSVKSPGSIYRTNSAMTTPEIPYSPLPPYGRQPSFMDTPKSNVSWNSNMSRARTDPMTERLIQHRATKAAEWTVGWKTPTMMVVSFLAGILLAIGQHLLYSSLHRTAEQDENKKIRVVLYGRALAYLSKVAFGGCVILCYRQRIWRTFRERALSVWSIDQIFLGTEDPSLFLNWEVVNLATLVTAMAIVLWLIPVATIVFSPAALTFGDTMSTDTTNLLVPTLDFNAESIKDWRVPVNRTDGPGTKRSLIYLNTTDSTAKEPGWFDYYDQPSAELKRISLMTGYSLINQSLNREDARRKSCGGAFFNCTYTISFVAPGYNCQQHATGPQDDQKLADMGAPFNTSVLSPYGHYAYLSDVDTGDYSRPQPSEGGISNKGGVPLGAYPDDFGFFKSEPMLWIGYSIVSKDLLPKDSPYATNWTNRYDQYIFACTHYETNYTVKYTYVGPSFYTNVTYEFMKPIVDTNFTLLDDGSFNRSDPGPAANFISPRTDVGRYKKTAAYHALGERLRYFLRGNIEEVPPNPGPPYVKVYSEITSTRLVSTASTPKENLPELLQNFYADMILSLFSAPQMLVISNTSVPVHRSRYQSTFIYNSRKLWVCYAPVILAVFIILIIGAWTIYVDGTTWSVGFSRIMVTTRNTTLDDISRGACLGNDPFPLELMHTRLKFGVLNEGGHEQEYMGLEGLQGAGHCAFGVPSEITSIRRGMPYAGLPRKDGEERVKEKVD